MKEDQLPLSIKPDPIISAVLEIRFNSEMPESTIVGAIYNYISEDYPRSIPSPIPAEIRQSVPDFKFAAELEVSNENYKIGIGKNVFSQKMVNKYLGWSDFYQNFESIFNKIIKHDKLIKTVNRIGLRYLSFFKNPQKISNSLKLKIEPSMTDIYTIEQTTFYRKLHINDIKLNLNIQDTPKVNNSKEGLLVDIDAFFENNTESDFIKILDTIKNLHLEEKRLFFGLLKEEFLNSLNPVYKD